jgi:hypothetical protein
MECSITTKTTRQFIKESASNLIRKIQNRISAQKVRGEMKSKSTDTERRLVCLEKENKILKKENLELIDQNQKLSRKCAFYENNLKNTMKSHHDNESDDSYIKIVTDNNDEIYSRIDPRSDNKKFLKSFLLLTVFTIVMQTVDVDFSKNNILGGGDSSATLNAYQPKSLSMQNNLST